VSLVLKKDRPASPALGILSIIAALIYGASPIDLIPDLLVLVGWVDDAAIGGLLMLFGARILVRYYRAKRGRQLALK
jgi:uncharacterized membrane protein YkvA (DUF1232 family)